jgi:hypothetical protein
MLKVRCRIQKCWPVRKWLWNAQSEMLKRWLDLVSVKTIYIYLGIFRGRQRWLDLVSVEIIYIYLGIFRDISGYI